MIYHEFKPAAAVFNAKKLRMAFWGPAGSGKTMSMLKTAFELLADVPNPKVLVGDTSNGAANDYAKLFPRFDVQNLDDHSPQTFKAFVEFAENAGYDAVILDNASHEWMGRNGVLEQVDRKLSMMGSKEAWAEVTVDHDAFIRAITDSKLHVLVSLRAKIQSGVEKDERGRMKVQKFGLQPICREGMDYDFDVWGRMDLEGNTLTIEKTRSAALQGASFSKPGKDLADALREWLSGDALTDPKGRIAREQRVSAVVARLAAEETAASSPAGAVAPLSADAARQQLLVELGRIIAGRDEFANAIFQFKKQIRVGQTWQDLSDADLETTLKQRAAFVKKLSDTEVAARKLAG